MGGAQPLAVTMNEGVNITIEVDIDRIKKRIDTILKIFNIELSVFDLRFIMKIYKLENIDENIIQKRYGISKKIKLPKYKEIYKIKSNKSEASILREKYDLYLHNTSLFLIEGFGKISMQENVIMYMENYGVPAILFVPATVLEILFPIILIVGYKTKWAASVMAIFTFTVAIIFHTDFSEEMQMILFLKDIAIAGGFMIIAAYGSSKISLDYYFKSKEV